MERCRRRSLLVTFRVAAVLGLAGCSNSQQTSANPFMQPDRVPPPATRTIAPGTAAPYYPGDPVPAAQMAAPGAAAMAQVPGPPEVSPQSFVAAPPAISNPAATIPTATTPTAASAIQMVPATPAEPLAFSNERTVSVPRDNEDLRFAVPAAAETQAMAAQAPAAVPAANQFAAAPQSAVVPASYTQAMATQPMPADAPMPTASTNTDGNPWRSPQIPGGSAFSNNGVMQAQYVQPQSAQPTMLAPQPMQTVAPTQQMSVELRPVPSPMNVQMSAPTMMQPSQAPQMQMAPMQTSPPRMRFPSWSDPTTWFTPQPETAPAANQQLVGYMVPGPNGTQQMISVEQYQAMFGGVPQPAGSVANTDGFRARGTATK